LNAEEFRELQEFIYRASGMYFPASKQEYLEEKLRRRAQACAAGGVPGYLRGLRDGSLPAELPLLFNEITVNETYFWRDLPQLEAFRRHIVPELLASGHEPLRVLSAGCSTGEEPYSLAILLHEHFPQRTASVRAIDISARVLAQAERGEYAEYAVRLLSEPQRQKYFERRDGLFRLRDGLRGAVRFRRRNLMDLGAPAQPPYHVIFCRYVLIYFTPESKALAIRRFRDALVPGGYLVLGNSESLLDISDDFAMLHFPSAIIYKRRERHGTDHGTCPPAH
jgi:chemotaxis protein methyltransferase CheR